ncbi:glycosyltransferase family 2 protein [Sulfitobacter sp. PR48]|uniref:glycosyltransferase family 2 protein n=1 Tax=Sulfitobacter sp. PR48 TaxID=3028383 RepID=UPI00237A96A7|nr:glycosyltransferase family 2 protein [Sulfitobacter sp. PR48]MDD9722140.1 glycosyltransferase family 2 protein [Sulfitobacter sp. PR48]
MQSGKWSVVAILREPREVLERFVAWHLHQGADRIFLYFDDPEDPGIAAMDRFGDRVVVTRCTEAFWEELGVLDAVNFTKRQNAAILHAYRQIKDGWVAVVDGDELMWSRDRPLSEVLASLPESDRSVVFRPVEYVNFPQQPDRLLFRRFIDGDLLDKVFGIFAVYMNRNRGFAGHVTGKTLTRAGLEVSRAHPHWFVDAQGKRITDGSKTLDDGCALLHFYFLNYADWRRKADFRLKAFRNGRRDLLLAKMNRLVKLGRERKLRHLWSRLHQITPEQHDTMKAHDLLLELDMDMKGIVHQYFGEVEEHLRMAG